MSIHRSSDTEEQPQAPPENPKTTGNAVQHIIQREASFIKGRNPFLIGLYDSCMLGCTSLWFVCAYECAVETAILGPILPIHPFHPVDADEASFCGVNRRRVRTNRACRQKTASSRARGMAQARGFEFPNELGISKPDRVPIDSKQRLGRGECQAGGPKSETGIL